MWLGLFVQMLWGSYSYNCATITMSLQNRKMPSKWDSQHRKLKMNRKTNSVKFSLSIVILFGTTYTPLADWPSAASDLVFYALWSISAGKRL